MAEPQTKASPARPATMFERRGRTYHPTDTTLGPWGRDTLHGGPVAGLFAHLLSASLPDADLQLARLTVDMPRAVPAQPLVVATRWTRRGRRVLTRQATINAPPDQPVAFAAAIFLARSEEPRPDLRQFQTSIASIAQSVSADLPSTPVHHANSIGLRKGPHSTYWVSMDLTVVDDLEPTAAERAVVAADWANPSANLDADGISYINPDLTVFLHRDPHGPWIGVGPAMRNSTKGVALSDCPLSDLRGVFGRSVATGLAAGMTVRAPGLDQP